MRDRDDPFDEFFREIERMMNDMMGVEPGYETDPTGFASNTHVDVHESDTQIRVVADLPGVAKADLTLTCDGELVTISAANDRREFDERVRLPAHVDEHSANATFNNGVLEVVFDKEDGSADIRLE